VWIRRQSRYGLANIDTGSVLREPDLHEVHGFQDGIAIARAGDQVGLLDSTGQWRLPPSFDEIHPFANALAVVRQGKKFGYIDLQCRTVVAAQFDDADDINSAGVARVRQGSCCGLIRRDGTIALPLHFTGIEWSDEMSGWLCTRAAVVVLVQADGSVWVDGEWNAIEVLVRGALLRVRRGCVVGLLNWHGEAILPCEFDYLSLSDMHGAGPHSAQWKWPQVRLSSTRKSTTPSSTLSSGVARRDIVARRDGRVGLVDWHGAVLVPFEFSYIDALESQTEGTLHLTTPTLLRVVSPPGAAAPRVGVWDIAQQRCIVPCRYDFLWTALFAADGTYGFIVANRNPKRGYSSLGRYRVGLLHADGSVLVPQQYAWIAESTLLNRADAMMDIRSTLYHDWSHGDAVRASLSDHGPLVGLNAAGEQCALPGVPG
jgi:hypothetical protein